MNFLSHFYFERNESDEYRTLGVVLPDLVKNAQNSCNLYPQKERHLFETDNLQKSLLIGWERHIIVDNIFHSSEYFKVQTGILKQLILPVVADSPVKPFFLAHIGLELMLDHLLVADGIVNVNTFYSQLEKTNKEAVKLFLETCRLQDTSVFCRFLNNFISGRYLLSYQKLENISYALNRICMRVWPASMDQNRMDNLTIQLVLFKSTLQKNFESIFISLKSRLN